MCMDCVMSVYLKFLQAEVGVAEMLALCMYIFILPCIAKRMFVGQSMF